jgi:hypothetical protein
MNAFKCYQCEKFLSYEYLSERTLIYVPNLIFDSGEEYDQGGTYHRECKKCYDKEINSIHREE